MISGKLAPGDEARFAKALQKMVALSGEPVEDIMRKQGRIAAEKLAWFTQRVGKTAKAGKAHKQDVANTIDNIYVNPARVAKSVELKGGRKAANRFRRYIRERKTTEAEDMLTSLGVTFGRAYKLDVGMFDGGNRHTRWLKKRGKSILVVINYRDVKEYKKRKMAQVGALKAGWAKAARDLGGSGKLPAYITKGHKTRGHGSVKGKGGKATLRITNRADYIIQNRQMTDIFRVQGENMEKIIEKMLNRKTRKITRKT